MKRVTKTLHDPNPGGKGNPSDEIHAGPVRIWFSRSPRGHLRVHISAPYGFATQVVKQPKAIDPEGNQNGLDSRNGLVLDSGGDKT